MGTRPVVFLGVDGVLESPRDPEGFEPTSVDRADGIWSLERGQAIAALDADVVWATDWSVREDWHSADVLEEMAHRTGLPSGLPRVRFDHTAPVEAGNSGLAPGVYEYLGTHRVERFAWIDATLGSVDRELIDAWPYPTLAVQPDRLHGLSRTEVDKIRGWLSDSAAAIAVE